MQTGSWRIRTVILAVIAFPWAAVAAPDWPGDATVAVNLTFDLDAETVWWQDNRLMTGDPGSLSQGRYGPTVALPKILDLLERHDVVATFFVPTWVIGHYPDAVKQIVERGHEVGAHGVRHEPPASLTSEEERVILVESVRVIETLTGRKPAGYRAPAWALSDATLAIVAEAGFVYSSNLMDHDLPYRHADAAGLVELPVSWVLDDAPFFWFDEDSWNKSIHSAADVQAIWREEFAAAYRDGGYFNLTLHPQFIGRPARLHMLDEFIAWMKSQGGVWFASCETVARHVSGAAANP